MTEAFEYAPDARLQRREGYVMGLEKDVLARFNPGLAYVQVGDDAWRLDAFYREIRSGNNLISELRRASSFDEGESWQEMEPPIIEYPEPGDPDPEVATYMTPDLVKELSRRQLNSIEDARLVQIGGKWYAALVFIKILPYEEGQLAVTAIARVDDDFKKFKIIGLATPPDRLDELDDRNWALFSRKINGLYWAITRRQILEAGKYLPVGDPERPGFMSIAYSNSLTDWPVEKEIPLEMPYRADWESEKVNVGPPPIETKDGWLLLYEGVGQNVYSLGAMLLDLENPAKVLARLPYPILRPERDYETDKIGHERAHRNVIFANGAVVLGDYLIVSYGAADTHWNIARVKLSRLLGALKAYGPDRSRQKVAQND